jgi:hypothetical protein|tara:strand:- start:1440 stop:1853 length:414 start_codon:yes stop_codon:yes gene_type:complete
MSKTRNTGNLVSENNIFVDVTNDRVGIGSTQPTAKLNVSGIVSATSYYGDGSNLSGINASGGGDFATALSSTAPLSSFYKVPKLLEIGTGKNITVQSDSDSDNKAYIRENGIHVGSGSTVHIADGTTLIVDVLNLFE